MKKLLIITMIALAPTLSLADESWTGFNAGIQLSQIDGSANTNDNGNASLGLHAGYLHQFDSYVFGGEVTYDTGAEIVTNSQVEKVDTFRVKFKGGHVIGKTLLYGVIGYSNLNQDTGSHDGYSAGVGASFRATDKVLIGAEYLRDTYNGSGVDIKTDSIALRLSYTF